jgi:hypothetical protein
MSFDDFPRPSGPYFRRERSDSGGEDESEGATEDRRPPKRVRSTPSQSRRRAPELGVRADDEDAGFADDGSAAGGGAEDFAAERRLLDEITRKPSARERPLVPETAEGITEDDRAALKNATKLRAMLHERSLRDDGSKNPPETRGEGRMRGVLKAPFTHSDIDRRISDDFEGLAYTPVAHSSEREARELLGPNTQSHLDCPLCLYAATSDTAMLHPEWAGLMETWVNSVFSCHPAMTAHHVAAYFNTHVRPVRNRYRREALLQEKPDASDEDVAKTLIPEISDVMVYDHFQTHTSIHEIACVRQMRVLTSMLVDMESSLFYVRSLEDQRVRIVPNHIRDYTRLIQALSSVAKDLRAPGISSVGALRERMGLTKR